MQRERRGNGFWPFVAGVVAGGAGALLVQSLRSHKTLHPRLLRVSPDERDIAPVVVVPGILGSQLCRPDGTQVWLNLGNAFGYHDLSLPIGLPLDRNRDDLVPQGLLGVDTVLPRVFGFTEYADLLKLLGEAGFRRDAQAGLACHVFDYDWRRDLVESSRRLHDALEELAAARGDREARFNLIGHSMGGLVARYYLRYGTAEPDTEVTWAGARRVASLTLVGVPNGGSIPSLDAILNGNRVGLSYTTLAGPVIARMPSVYQLLPPEGTEALLDHRGAALEADLHDVATWERFGWGPFNPAPPRRRSEARGASADRAAQRAFLAAALSRARAFQRALARPVPAPCPVRVALLGGDCLLTLGRAIVPEARGEGPRFEASSQAQAELMLEAGDGRVTRASALAAHLPEADTSESGSGIPELRQTFFGFADHHGIYSEPTFQSLLLRILLRPARRRRRVPEPVPQALPVA